MATGEGGGGSAKGPAAAAPSHNATANAPSVSQGAAKVGKTAVAGGGGGAGGAAASGGGGGAKAPADKGWEFSGNWARSIYRYRFLADPGLPVVTRLPN